MAKKKTSSWKDQKHTLEQRRDAITSLSDTYRGLSSVDLCKKLVEIRSEQERLELEQQQLSEQVEAIGQLLADRWTEEGISSLEVADVGSFSLHNKLYVSAKDKPAYHQWLKDNGMDVLIQPQVAPKTTEALVRERLEQGLPCDEMGLNINYKLTVR